MAPNPAVIDLSVAKLPAVINLMDDSDDEVVEVVESLKSDPNAPPPSRKRKGPPPLYAVLEVFPDADTNYVQELLTHNPDVSAVLLTMAESGYTKTTKKLKPTGSALVHKDNTLQRDYMDSRSFEASDEYYSQALEQLQIDFSFLNKKGADNLLRASSKHYALAHDKLLKTIMGNSDELALENVKTVVAGKLPPIPVRNSVRNLTGSVPRRSKRNTKALVTNPILIDELKFVKNKLKEWIEHQQNKLQRIRNKQRAERQGTGVECSCCFDTYELSDMVACKEGHLFCLDCLSNYAETQIFSQGNLGIDKATKEPAMDLQCFHGEGCNAGFARDSLEKALQKKSIQKYDELQFQISIDKAGLQEKMCECPSCNYSAAVPPTQMVFLCPVAECGFESCIKCGEESHVPLRCEEIEKKKSETKGRLAVEEAISAAKIRHCPACKRAFVKSDGCNKVRCGCGKYVCYICHQNIKGNYSHFCQTPHCTHEKCKKCPLHTRSEEDDARAMREAGYAAAEKVRNVVVNGQATEVHVDVDKILKSK